MQQNKLHSFFGATVLFGNNKKTLNYLTVLFVAIVVVALFILVRYTFSQLQWESFHQNRLQAEASALRLDKNLQEIVGEEEARSIVDYRFLIVSSSAQQLPTDSPLFYQRSTLSQLPLQSKVPGMIGYFQLDENNQFSTPLVPDNIDQAERYGLSQKNYLDRVAESKKLVAILIDNKLSISSGAEKMVLPPEVVPSTSSGIGQAISGIKKEKSIAFDKLKNQQKFNSSSKLGRVEELLEESQNVEFDKRSRLETDKNINLSSQEVSKVERKEESKEQQASTRQLRKEAGVLAESIIADNNNADTQQPITLQLFENEVEPFQVNLLESGHIVIFRRVWTENQRLIQGMLIDKMRFIESIIQKEFVDSALLKNNRVAIAYQNDFLAAYGQIEAGGYGYLESARQLSGTLLYQTALLSPFNDFKIVFTLGQLSAGASGQVVLVSALVLLLTVLIGAWLFNRYASAQNALMLQQQNFISSVSHELKTPLTSIRMYGEILKEGWVSESKKNEYYHFIYDESERLSRLINNVLQLAKLNRNTLSPNFKPQTSSKLISITESKLSGQAVAAGFDLIIKSDLVEAVQEVEVNVDEDLFIQIMINLVDNAIKYSNQSETKKIDIVFYVLAKQSLAISVRDYGSGIEAGQLDKIFALFYRAKDELIRETKGTGIGLALVSQYTQLMSGEVSAKNQTPGFEVTIKFPLIRRYP